MMVEKVVLNRNFIKKLRNCLHAYIFKGYFIVYQ